MRLNQVTVPAKDIPASIAFYRTLGLRLIVEEAHYARFELPEGEGTFSLHLTDGHVPRSDAPVVYFECARLDEDVARLKASGLRFEADPEDKSWLWREAYLRDPAGNLLCLYFAGENRRYPPWRIG